MSANTLEIIRAIGQVVSNSHDGAVDKEGNPIKIGLKREEGHPLYDSRIMDGFRVRFEGPNLGIIYHSEITMKDMHEPTFQNDIEKIYNNIVQFLQKEYKLITKKSLSLKPLMDEVQIEARWLNQMRCWVECYKRYKINNIKDVDEYAENRTSIKENLFRKFLLDSPFYKK